MKNAKNKLLSAPALLLLTSAFLTACNNNMDLEPPGETPEGAWHRFWNLGKWRPLPEPYKNNVELVSLDYKITFEPGSTELNRENLSQLHNFLREQGVSGNDYISVDGPKMVTGGQTPVTTNRVSTLVAELNRVGLGAQAASDASSEAGELGEEEILVRVRRYVVLSPECEAPDPALGERPEVYWSCSTTANLGAMIANPRDLAHGRNPGPATAEPNAAGIERYRRGELPPLKTEDTSN